MNKENLVYARCITLYISLNVILHIYGRETKNV